MCAYIAQRTGTQLSRQQLLRLEAAVHARSAGRSDEEFLAFLKSAQGGPDLSELMATISVHKTDLFRDEIQLDAFFRHVLTPMVRKTSRPLRLWSAGCATGEEVATLLILLREAGAHEASTVLGTDISAAALREAEALSFHPDAMKRVASNLKTRYFVERGGRFELSVALRSQASFVRHNLMDFPYPLSPVGEGFDVVFCRNVLIYFTEDAFDRVVAGLAGRLAEEGTLVLSAAEPILRPFSGICTLRHDQAFFYGRRPPGAAPETPPPSPPAPSPVPRLRLFTQEIPVVAPSPPSRRDAGEEFEVVPPPPPLPPGAELSPREEAESIFHSVLDRASAGETDAQTEAGLRKCLYLDPHFAQARYLLGMLLEQRGSRADAAGEYRRAMAALTEGKAAAIEFFLNSDRLKTACQLALKRLGYK